MPSPIAGSLGCLFSFGDDFNRDKMLARSLPGFKIRAATINILNKSAEKAPKFKLSPVAFTPLTLLATIMKCVLKERITDKETERICVSYYRAVQDIWDD